MTKYRFLVEALIKANEYIDECIGLFLSYGGSFDVQASYGLTFPGIKKTLKLLSPNTKIKVIVELNALISGLEKLAPGEQAAYVISAGILSKGSRDGHAISLFARRIHNRVLLFNNDSQGARESNVLLNFAKSFDITVFASKVIRQTNEPTCYAFAISDCLEFCKNPKLIDIILETFVDNGHTSLKKNEITKMPEGMMRISDREKDVLQALEYQKAIINEAFSKS